MKDNGSTLQVMNGELELQANTSYTVCLITDKALSTGVRGSDFPIYQNITTGTSEKSNIPDVYSEDKYASDVKFTSSAFTKGGNTYYLNTIVLTSPSELATTVMEVAVYNRATNVTFYGAFVFENNEHNMAYTIVDELGNIGKLYDASH